MGSQMERHTLPDGSEPQVSHCTIDFTPAVRISLGDTILTLTGFTTFFFAPTYKKGIPLKIYESELIWQVKRRTIFKMASI